MATGNLSINFSTSEIDISKNTGEDSTNTEANFRIYSKTPTDFLNHNSYTAPKYAEWINGTMSCIARKTVAASSKPLFLKINGQEIGDVDIAKNDTSISKDFDTTKSVIITIEEGTNKGYLTLAGNATWSCSVHLNSNHLYLKNPTIALTYNCPKYTLNVQTDTTKGTVACANGSSSMEFDVTTKGQTQQTTITATPKDGYFFMGWSDGNEEPSRAIVLEEANLTSSNTQLTYTAIFGKKELYVGSKRLDAIYVGTKKAKVYRGTTRIL